jgi:hypothetical protein
MLATATADEVPAFTAMVEATRVRLAFIDESEEQQPRRTGLGHLVSVGGVVVPETAVAPYSAGLARIRHSLGVPEDTELKWSPSDGSWLKTPAGNAIRTQLREQMLNLAVDLGVSSVVVVWDRGLVSWPVNEVQVEILGWVYERISMCVPVDEVALVIADEPGGDRRDRKQWLAETLQLTNHGTEYVTPDRVVLPIVTTPSHHVPHLQLADLVVGATTAAVAGNRYALGLAPLLHQLAHKNAYGFAGGAGIKLFPNDLLNLHHWAFAEDSYWKVGTGEYWPLPIRDLPYATDDGLAVTEGSGRG